ncbi:MAG TPA: Yip1 family protein [Fontimonas sp.]
MDREHLISRAKGVVLTPKTEWPQIAVETDSVAGIYLRYIIWLAALPAIAGFLKGSILGIGVPFVGTVRVGIVSGLSNMLLQYGLALLSVYLLALLVNALAPTFGGEKNEVQALKATAYASTASWLAGVMVLVPWLGSLLALAGAIYAIYLLYLGLPQTMRCPPEKAVPYTAVTILAAIVLSLVLGTLIAKLTGVADIGRDARSDSIEISHGGNTVTLDADKMEQWAKKVEAASQKMEQASKSGDSADQQAAMGEVMGALMGNDGKVEAMDPQALKAFLPETLGDYPRRSYSAERNSALGLQLSEAKARYADDDSTHAIDLEISDLGGAQGLAALATWAGVESESESDSGYERSRREGDRMISEQWDATNRIAQYKVLVGKRFTVALSGSGVEMDDLKSAARAIDLDALEKLAAKAAASTE